MKRLLTAGIFGTILGIVGAGTAKASIVSSGFLDEKLTEYALSTSLDLKANQSDFTELNTQISESVDNLKSLWDADIGILAYGVDPNKFNNDIIGAFGLVEGFILYSMESLTDGWTDKNDGATYLGIKDLNTKIGTLPTGNFPDFPGSELLSNTNLPLTYPTSLAELITAIYGDEETDVHGLLESIIAGFPFDTDGDGRVDSHVGPLTNYSLAKNANDLANANATKIGDLPSGNFPIFPYSKQMFDIINFEYPQNLSQLIYALFGNTETNTHGAFSYLMNDIIGALPFGDNNISEIIGEPIQNGRYSIPIYELIYWGTNNSTYLLPNTNGTFSDAPLLGLYELSNRIDKIGTVPDGKNLAGMIGTLPDGYDSVGAALTAIKGIAEDAKAAALAAIPDPKQEGSSGKFVLTVDIVGDNATYRWEKIDREGETTTE